jgi:predicted ATPase
MGGELAMPSNLAILAEVYGTGGRAEEGLRAVAEGLAISHRTGERRFEAELYRLKGELLLQQAVWQGSLHPEAETCFRQAIDTARRQHAMSWELRAAMSLSRLWQTQGKRVEARRLLEETYSWFTEGFETLDLREAKALLIALQ